ncbi:MAG: hypothetical protein R3B39_00640 [Candidatus Paceibacterota bacterium]
MNKLSIDTSHGIKEMIAAGRFDRIEVVAKHFFISDRSRYTVTPKIFGFDTDISSEMVIKNMASEGFRPAKFEELLAYAEVSNSTESKTALVALGSTLEVSEVGGMKIPSMFLQTKAVRSSMQELLAYADVSAVKGFESAVVELVSKLKPREAGVTLVSYAILQKNARRLYVSPFAGGWWRGMSFLGVKDI